MTSTMPDRVNSNNFDLFRTCAALAVLYSHHFALTGSLEPGFFGINSLGGGSVIIFFIISGYLIASSWDNDPNLFRFSIKRILRIWPALIVVVGISAFLLGPMMTSLSSREYFSHPYTYSYLNTLRLKIQYILPGVFSQNPYPNAVNGSLWTIPLEVRCYIILGALGLLRFLKNKKLVLFIVFLYLLWFITKSSADIHGNVNIKRELIAFFLIGTLLYFFKAHWENHWKSWILGISITSVILIKLHLIYTASLIILPFLVIFLGTKRTPFISKFGKWGDPSYGIYLLAFPIQQTIISLYFEKYGFYWTLCASASLTTIFAYILWHAVEKHALRLKPNRNFD